MPTVKGLAKCDLAHVQNLATYHFLVSLAWHSQHGILYGRGFAMWHLVGSSRSRSQDECACQSLNVRSIGISRIIVPIREKLWPGG